MVKLAFSWSRGRLPRPGTTTGTRLLRVAIECGVAIARYLRNRRGEWQLAKMSDYELHDLGITRSDIRRAVWQDKVDDLVASAGDRGASRRHSRLKLRQALGPVAHPGRAAASIASPGTSVGVVTPAVNRRRSA